MIRFGDMQLATRFKSVITSDDEIDKTIVLVKMPPNYDALDRWNAFNPISGKCYHIDTEVPYPLETENLDEEEKDSGALYLADLLGRMKSTREEYRKAEKKCGSAVKAMYTALATLGYTFNSMFNEAVKAGMWVNDEKSSLVEFRMLLQHLKDRATRE